MIRRIRRVRRSRLSRRGGKEWIGGGIVRTALGTALGTVLAAGLLFAPAGCTRGSSPGAGTGMIRGLKTVFQEDFRKGAKAWEMTDPEAWEIQETDLGQALALTGASDYQTPVRSPRNRAMVKDLELTDFILELQAQYTGRDYNHSDLCFFFGYKDPSHFYYAHLAKAADPNANSIFLVNGADRVSIAEERTEGTEWGSSWHKVRVSRDTLLGTIEVYFDDMQTPVMRAKDRTFLRGGIGVGSFDDTGNFADIRIWGTPVEED